MTAYVVRPLRRITSAVLAGDTPHQLALGFALGMVLGLMPKGNLIALSLFVLLFSLRVNTRLGLLAIVMFSCVAPLVDPLADKLGLAVLSANSLQASYAAVFNLPLGPWLGFQNTAVTGSLLVGLYCMYPAYWFSLVGIGWLQPRLAGSREPGESNDDGRTANDEQKSLDIRHSEIRHWHAGELVSESPARDAASRHGWRVA